MMIGKDYTSREMLLEFIRAEKPNDRKEFFNRLGRHYGIDRIEANAILADELLRQSKKLESESDFSTRFFGRVRVAVQLIGHEKDEYRNHIFSKRRFSAKSMTEAMKKFAKTIELIKRDDFYFLENR